MFVICRKRWKTVLNTFVEFLMGTVNIQIKLIGSQNESVCC